MEETKQNVVYSRAMKDLSVDDMPREKALKHGFEVLTVPELMAILIGSGHLYQLLYVLFYKCYI